MRKFLVLSLIVLTPIKIAAMAPLGDGEPAPRVQTFGRGQEGMDGYEGILVRKKNFPDGTAYAQLRENDLRVIVETHMWVSGLGVVQRLVRRFKPSGAIISIHGYGVGNCPQHKALFTELTGLKEWRRPNPMLISVEDFQQDLRHLKERVRLEISKGYYSEDEKG